MVAVESKSFSSPDERREPPSTRIDVVNVGTHAVARFTLQPGWHWKEHVAPVVGTNTCQATHLGTVLSGRMHIAAADGSEVELVPGGAYLIEPGHDAWVVGDEPCVVVEFQSAATFGKPS